MRHIYALENDAVISAAPFIHWPLCQNQRTCSFKYGQRSHFLSLFFGTLYFHDHLKDCDESEMLSFVQCFAKCWV